MRNHLAAALLSLACTFGGHAQGSVVDVVEFYNATLDHYFISSLQADIAALDSGALKGWVRTGLTFKANDDPVPGASPVCRFYIPPAQGDSHFYSASPAECADVRTKFPTFSYESPSVMYVGLPDAASGACAPGTTAVYRLWNNRPDTNHRYTTVASVRASMIAKGYVPEGYGSDGVAMCAFAPAATFDLSVAPASVLLLPGETQDVYVTVIPRDGFTGVVTLAGAGWPAGVTAQFTSQQLTIGATPLSALVHVTAAASAPVAVDPSQVEMRGEGGGITGTRPLEVAVVSTTDPIAMRLRAGAAVQARAQELRKQGLTRLPLVQAVAAYMATLPAYTATGVDTEYTTAWGTFPDGTSHIFVANRDLEPASAFARRPEIQPRDGAEIPQRNRAMLLHSFGRNAASQDPISEMRDYLVGKGWSVDGLADGDASVETLKRLADRGFFYMNSHSSRLPADDPNEPENKIFSVTTSTVVSLALERAYRAEILAKQLVWFMAENGDQVRTADGGVFRAMDMRYAFTYRFVDRYMSFPKGSVVFVNGCYTGRNEAFVSAFIRKGAGLYMGWTQSITQAAADRAPPYFVDRMLGANKHADKESPPQRAFDSSRVLDDMARKGLDYDPAYKATLIRFLNPSLERPPIFAPSIRMAEIDEIDELLTLHGEFGSDKGSVSVGGASLGVVSWAPDEIVADLPAKGAGSSGDVIVEVRGVKSNARQITQWSVGVDFKQTIPFFQTFEYQGSGTLRFRGDVGGWREEPGQKVKYVERGGYATKDSKIAVTASGTWTLGGSAGSCTSTLSGSGDFVSIAANKGLATGRPVVLAAFSVQADSKAAAYGFLLAGEQTPFTVTICNGQQTKPLATMGTMKGIQMLPYQQDDDPDRTSVPGFAFTLNASYGMPPQTSNEQIGSLIGNISVTTQATVPTSPPRDTDDSGK